MIASIFRMGVDPGMISLPIRRRTPRMDGADGISAVPVPGDEEVERLAMGRV
jgi:hypothetical protein